MIYPKIQLEKAAYGFALIGIFGLAWSAAFFRIGIYGAALCLLFSLVWLSPPSYLLRSPIVCISGILLLWLLLGAAYSSAPKELILHDLGHYRKLLAVAPLVFLLSTWKRRLGVIYALLIGSMVLLMPTWLDFLGFRYFFESDFKAIENDNYQAHDHGNTTNLVYWRNHIVHGFFVCLLLSASAIAFIYRNKHKWVYVLIAGLAVIDLLFLIRGRTALICTFLVFPIILLLQLKSLQLRLIIFALSLFSIMALLQVPQIRGRLESVVSEAQSYTSTAVNRTSAGIRIHYWMTSLALLEHAPIVGAGLGSFRNALIQNNDPLLNLAHYHTHNEFLTIASQDGLIGLCLFLVLLYEIFQAARRSEHPELRLFGVAFILIFVLNALTDSSLFNEMEGWCFVVLAAVFAAESCSSQKPETA